MKFLNRIPLLVPIVCLYDDFLLNKNSDKHHNLLTFVQQMIYSLTNVFNTTDILSYDPY